MATTRSSIESIGVRGRPFEGAAAARTGELFELYGRTVSGLCRALLRDRGEAEDAAQQTFLSAHRALMNGRTPREPAAWLATIARNECWARMRSRRRDPVATAELEAVSPAPDPLSEAIRRADLAALWRAVDGLPEQQREAILLREFGGLSYEELAAALAVSLPAVESLLFRARQRLRRQLRTAYASLTGGSWLDSLARIAVGGGAPVAAKVAVLGVGAAAVTGGAVMGPQLEDRQHHRAPAPAVQQAQVRHAARTIARHVVQAAPPPALALPPRPVPTAAPATHAAPVHREHGAERSDSGGGRDDGRSEHQTVSAVVATTTASAEHEDRSTAGERSDGGSGSSSDGGSTSDGGGPDGGSSDAGVLWTQGSGSDGGGGD